MELAVPEMNVPSMVIGLACRRDRADVNELRGDPEHRHLRRALGLQDRSDLRWTGRRRHARSSRPVAWWSCRLGSRREDRRNSDLLAVDADQLVAGLEARGQRRAGGGAGAGLRRISRKAAGRRGDGGRRAGAGRDEQRREDQDDREDEMHGGAGDQHDRALASRETPEGPLVVILASRAVRDRSSR